MLGDDEEEDPNKRIDKQIVDKLNETQDLLTSLRDNAPDMTIRVQAAESMKGEGNGLFSTGKPEQALRYYLSSLWLLRRSDPPLPKALKRPETPSGAALLVCMDVCMQKDEPVAREEAADEAEAAEVEDDEEEEPQPDTAVLRLGLMRNVARCAIGVSDPIAARKACNFVLAEEPRDAKALFLLARASEVEGDLSRSLEEVARFLEVEPNNREALQLQASLRDRKKREKKQFGGMFDRAQQTKTGDLYNEEQIEAEREARRDAEGKLRLEDIAKLDPNQWADQLKKLNDAGNMNAYGDGAEMSKSMPNYAWMKHVLPKMQEVAPKMQEIRKAVVAQREADKAAENEENGENVGSAENAKDSDKAAKKSVLKKGFLQGASLSKESADDKSTQEEAGEASAVPGMWARIAQLLTCQKRGV